MAVIAAFDRLYRLKEEVRDLIAQAGIPQMDILCEFPSKGRAYPLKRPCICVGLSSIQMGAGALGGFVGAQKEGAELFGKRLEVEFRFDIYLPKGWEEGCHSYFCTLCDILTGQLPDMEKMWCGEMSSTAQNDGFTLPCYARLSALACQGEEEAALTQIILRRKEL